MLPKWDRVILVLHKYITYVMYIIDHLHSRVRSRNPDLNQLSFFFSPLPPLSSCSSLLPLPLLFVLFLLHPVSLQLTDGFVSPNARRKVLAGIVMTSSADDEEAVSTAKVISLGTGTKCINGEYMSDKV